MIKHVQFSRDNVLKFIVSLSLSLSLPLEQQTLCSLQLKIKDSIKSFSVSHCKIDQAIKAATSLPPSAVQLLQTQRWQHDCGGEKLDEGPQKRKTQNWDRDFF